MTHRSTFSRSACVALAGAVGVATVTLTASPASAAAFAGSSQASSDFITSGGSSCGTSNPGGAQGAPLNSTGTSASHSFTDTSVATDSGNPSDVTNMSASVKATASATEIGGEPRTFDMSSTLSTSVQPALGPATSCDSQATASYSTVSNFVLTAPMMLELTAKMRGGRFDSLQVFLSKTTGSANQLVATELNQSAKTRRVAAVPAGTYQLITLASSQLGEPDSGTEPTSDTASMSVHGVFSAPGSALGAEKGTGTKYVDLLDTLSCAGSSVAADFTKAAGKKPKHGDEPTIRKAKFSVNGEKVKTKKKPNKHTLVTLHGLDTTDEVLVEVLMTLKDKSKVEVRRTYLPCS
jgi:hypothetical protein